MLKLKREYVNKLKSIGFELFSHALEKILLSFNLFELNQKGEVGQYLRGILRDLEEKLVPTLQKRIDYVINALETTKVLVVNQASKWKNHFERIKDELSEALQALLNYDQNLNQKPQGGGVVEPFPFYNWLEN
jgi:hypothetical protein